MKARRIEISDCGCLHEVVTREQKIEALQRWSTAMQQMDAQMDSLRSVVGVDIDGPLSECVHSMQQAFTSLAAAYVGDAGGWLEWFWVENALGANAGEAGPVAGQLRPIQTVEDLVWVMA